jgi:hypothetical protein
MTVSERSFSDAVMELPLVVCASHPSRGQTIAPTPVTARPTMSVLTSRVPS